MDLGWAGWREANFFMNIRVVVLLLVLPLGGSIVVVYTRPRRFELWLLLSWA